MAPSQCPPPGRPVRLKGPPMSRLHSLAQELCVRTLTILFLACACFAGSAPSAFAQAPPSASHFRVLLQYPNPTGNGGPTGRLLPDEWGNLYGVGGGGTDDKGVVFRLSPDGHETILHKFGGPDDGAFPEAGLVRDERGNFYGTTSQGGQYGFGIVFRISVRGEETILHSFRGAPDGANPEGELLLDRNGNLYGTTAYGGKGCANPDGASGCGTVFTITPSNQESILYRFGNSPDGAYPFAGLVADWDGNLYGTTAAGGKVYDREFPLGTVFRVTPDGRETVLYRFEGITAGDGQNPQSTLIFGEFGDLYGTTPEGGPNGQGTVFRLSLTGVESVLYSFPGSATDGRNPSAGLVRDRDGNLYGTTGTGGDEPAGCYGVGCGVVFRLTPNNAETILQSFSDTDDAGCMPENALVSSPDGTFYGSTLSCGSAGNGTIFEFHPAHDLNWDRGWFFGW